MDEIKFKDVIRQSLEALIRDDEGILVKKVKEECINHKLAIHINTALKQLLGGYFQSLSVDLEYNKNYNDPKELIDKNNNMKAIRPDIIVHQRDNNDHNLIAIEAKKEYTNRKDKNKIVGLLSQYNYKFGLLISYFPAKPHVGVKILKLQAENYKVDTYRFLKAAKQSNMLGAADDLKDSNEQDEILILDKSEVVELV